MPTSALKMFEFAGYFRKNSLFCRADVGIGPYERYGTYPKQYKKPSPAKERAFVLWRMRANFRSFGL